MTTTPRYTHGHAESVLRSHRWRTAANSCGYLLERLRPGLRVLDVGAGPGTITADLAELVAPGRLTALEATDDALALSRTELARREIDADFVVGDVHALDLPDDTFDVVHAHQVLQHVADPVQALREMRRVCRPGGIVAARDSDYHGFVWYPADPVLDRWMELYQQAATAAIPTPVGACTPGPDRPASPTSTPPPAPGASAIPPLDSTGAACGPTAS